MAAAAVAAVVAPAAATKIMMLDLPPLPASSSSTTSSSAAEAARKRRRDYLASQRGLESLLDESLWFEGGGSGEDKGTPPVGGGTLPPRKKKARKVSSRDDDEDEEDDEVCGGGVVSPEDSSSTEDTQSVSSCSTSSAADKTKTLAIKTVKKAADKKGKHSHHPQQRKYDPDVPMTKEAAAAWRREQRRKRNRESAAASRQRQRDRIDELEAELAEWKTRVANALQEAKALEEAMGGGPVGEDPAETARPCEVWLTAEGSRATTPPPNHPPAPTVTPRASPSVSMAANHPDLSEDDQYVGILEEAMHLPEDDEENDDEEQGPEDDGLGKLLPPKMISRPAQHRTPPPYRTDPTIKLFRVLVVRDACEGTRKTAKINIPAVKIIGTAPSHSVHPEPTTSSFPSSFELLLPAPSAPAQDCVVPDPAASSHSALLVDPLMIPDELHDPEAADLFLAAATPPLLLDDDVVVDGEDVANAIEATTADPLIETELGEFLLDAVDWL